MTPHLHCHAPLTRLRALSQAYAADLAYLKQKVDAGGCVSLFLLTAVWLAS